MFGCSYVVSFKSSNSFSSFRSAGRRVRHLGQRHWPASSVWRGWDSRPAASEHVPLHGLCLHADSLIWERPREQQGLQWSRWGWGTLTLMAGCQLFILSRAEDPPVFVPSYLFKNSDSQLFLSGPLFGERNLPHPSPRTKKQNVRSS